MESRNEKLARLAQMEKDLAYHKLIVDTNKLSLNSSYGKLGSPYSYLYSPELVIQTTLTGQLAILMLIEKLTKLGAVIKSANTDSVDVLRHESIDNEISLACYEWELETGYNLDDTPYLAKHSESVNSYVAITPSGKVKGKGTFANESLMKSPSRQVCVDAVKSHFQIGSDIDGYIKSETNPHKFCTVKRVTGGAMFEGEEVGKMVRFYHSTKGGVLTYKKNCNKVPTSDGCRPMMNLPDTLPDDIDHDWYIKEAYSMLSKLGVNK